MSDFQLGKKITAPPAAPKPDEYERFIGSHGDRLMRNKRTGAIETAVPKKIPEPIPVPEVEHVYIFTTGAWDAVIKQMRQRQEEDGFPVSEFGIL